MCKTTSFLAKCGRLDLLCKHTELPLKLFVHFRFFSLVNVNCIGPKYEYHWADGQTVKKPIKCSAPKYIDYLMTWVQDQLDDEGLFPSKIGELSAVSPTNLPLFSQRQIRRH